MVYKDVIQPLLKVDTKKDMPDLVSEWNKVDFPLEIYLKVSIKRIQGISYAIKSILPLCSPLYCHNL